MFKLESKFIILGCPRSGTSFISKFLSYNGFKVGHEKLEKDGISSWCLVSGGDNVCYGPSYNEVIKKLGNNSEIYHQVRNPIDTISSITTIQDKSFQFASKFIPINSYDSLILKSMKFWFYWNELSENFTKKRYRVEDTNEYVKNFKLLDEKKINSRSHVNLNWGDIEKENFELSEKIKNMSIRYGY